MRETAKPLGPTHAGRAHAPTRQGVPVPGLRRQAGVFAIMLAVLLPVIIGFIGLALELGRMYNRKAEMQALADGIAVAAAKKLDGTDQGIANALTAAEDVVSGGDETATKPRYEYVNTMSFSSAAIRFAKSPDDNADWLDAATAKASPAGLAYVKVDTGNLDAAYGMVDLLFMRFVSKLTSLNIAHVSIAGRQRLKLTPLAICAMSKDPTQPFAERVNAPGFSELTEYGFRRGVSYNLLRLSPHTATPVNYVVDPISLPPKSGSFLTNTIGPYVCTGTVELPRVIGESLNLQSGFPIADFVNQLNSRFNIYSGSGKCNATAAPPDLNTTQYAPANLSWMDAPAGQAASEPPPTTPPTLRLETVADLAPQTLDTKAYGPLWAYSRPVPWSAYTPAKAEPSSGYLPFEATDDNWKKLYDPGPDVKVYPTDPKSGRQITPYFASNTEPASNYPGLRNRRVLNIPLLECPAIGTPGKVVAIGRFFMMVPAIASGTSATPSGIYAEFAGATLQEEVSGPVELYR